MLQLQRCFKFQPEHPNQAIIRCRWITPFECLVCRVQLRDERFSQLFHSPLARASETADLVWGDRAQPRKVMPSLREVDLYSFQGLLKAEGIARYGDEFLQWQKRPAEFEIDGHWPVRELWHRASLAWQVRRPVSCLFQLV